MEEKKVFALFEKAGVMKEGHFRLTSGKHSNRYMQCAQLMQYPEYTAEACRDLKEQMGDTKVDVVIGPATGAITLSYEMGRTMGTRALFAERENGQMTLRRNFMIEPGEQVLVVEDVITTGGSVKEVIEVVKSCGGEVVGVACIVNRSAGRADFGAKLFSLIELEIQTYEPDACPLCQQGIPVVKPGSRKI